MTIPAHYINEGLRIRKIYLSNLKEIIKLEADIENEKKKLETLKADAIDIATNKDISEVRKTLTLNNKLNDMENSIKVIQNAIRPFYENIEKLRLDADRLYVAIKEKYPTITAEEIEEQIANHM